jgi:hypothetical protein
VIRRTDHVISAPTLPTSGDLSVGIVLSRTEAIEFSLVHGGELLASPSDRFTPKKAVPDTHRIRGWLGTILIVLAGNRTQLLGCAAPSQLALPKEITRLLKELVFGPKHGADMVASFFV